MRCASRVGGARYDGVASFGAGRCSTTARRCWRSSCSISPATSTGRRSTSPSSAGSGHEQKFDSVEALKRRMDRLRAGARRAQARRQAPFRCWGRFASVSRERQRCPGRISAPTDRYGYGPRFRGDDSASDAEPPATSPPCRAAKRDYSETLFLPQTDFPMRAGLPQKEPEMLERWEQARALRPAARGRPRAATSSSCTTARLTPTATSISAHALNKILKDVVTRSQQMLGYDSQLRAGLGLPRPADRMEDRGGELPLQGQAEAGPRPIPPR